MKVYKWQLALADPIEDLDDTLMDDSPEGSIGAIMLGPIVNTPQQPGRTNLAPRKHQRSGPLNWYPYRPEPRRVNYQEPLEYRTPNTQKYNIPINNRFSPLRRGNQYYTYPQYRREFREERDFPRGGPRDTRKLESLCPL